MLGIQSLGPILRVAETDPCDSAEETRSSGLSVGAALEVEADSAIRAAIRQPAVPNGMTERDAWIVLVSVTGLGPVTFGSLLTAFGSARAVISAASGESGVERLREGVESARSRTDADGEATRGDLAVGVAQRLVEAVQSASKTLAHLASLGLEGVTLEDSDYPSRLRLIDMPPPLLFVRGDRRALDPGDAVAVVGTRWPTDKGRLVAGWIGAALANAGACVVSGMAVGIDGAAHAATIAEGGRTVAVLGGGHEHLFPRSHERLADAIVGSGGAVISEYAPDTQPSRGTFPRRNRLVSGMCDATVVVEAGRRSGALITAGWALEQGRECFLVPGPLDSPASAGCLDFLRSFPGQARVVCGIPELIEDLCLAQAGPAATQARSAPSSHMNAAGRDAVLASLSGLERVLADKLAGGPATADELAAGCGGSPASVLSALTLLELRGLVTAGFGRYLPDGPLRLAGGFQKK